MDKRNLRLLDAATHYFELLDSEQVLSIHTYAAMADSDLRDELIPYLEDLLATGEPLEATVCSTDEQMMAERVIERVLERKFLSSVEQHIQWRRSDP